RAAYHPSLDLSLSPEPQWRYGVEKTFPRANRGGLAGSLAVNIRWTVFDGGRRKNRLANAQANLRAAEAQMKATRDEVANQTWAAYSNLRTAFMQRQAALALLEAASQSYAAALETYNYGARSFLDVPAAQRPLADGQSPDDFARSRALTPAAASPVR